MTNKTLLLFTATNGSRKVPGALKRMRLRNSEVANFLCNPDRIDLSEFVCAKITLQYGLVLSLFCKWVAFWVIFNGISCENHRRFFHNFTYIQFQCLMRNNWKKNCKPGLITGECRIHYDNMDREYLLFVRIWSQLLISIEPVISNSLILDLFNYLI